MIVREKEKMFTGCLKSVQGVIEQSTTLVFRGYNLQTWSEGLAKTF